MATRKPQQMCALKIGFITLLLPASKGMRVMQELQSAVEADWDYVERGHHYTVKERPDLQLTLIDAEQISMPHAAAPSRGRRASRPSLLGHD
ncbi:hypothetical protein [Billgrantia ethanolica]|uniref:Uncharacterized protein n=1 Tax=Billgrantia ethanolica TaxID=2733486 RepID=A0ABS9A6D4_9GAMM|nr:hypothetical protein [Halomonas ethanolica]MCE8004251.1 hypothetical protein [Halomonas ethanolica]